MAAIIRAIFKYMHWIIISKAVLSVYDEYTNYQTQVDQMSGQVPIMQKKIKDQEKKIKVAKDFLNNLENAKKRVEEMTEQIQAIQRQLPTSTNDTQILQVFKQEAESINIKNVYLTPLEEKRKDFYYSKEYEFKGNGTFLQFLSFFVRIAEHERIYNIKNLEVDRSTDTKGRYQLVSTRAILEAFRYNPDFVETAVPEELEEEKKKANSKQGRRGRR